MERTTVRLPSDLLDRARKKAAAEGRTLTSLIEEGLRRVLSARTKALAGKRKLPRISKATGSLDPGFDWVNIASQAQELDDIEYAKRLRNRFK